MLNKEWSEERDEIYVTSFVFNSEGCLSRKSEPGFIAWRGLNIESENH